MSTAEASAVTAATKPQSPGGGGWFRRHTFELVLITPLVAYILILTVAPIVDTIRLSFSAPRAGLGTLKSYSRIFHDPVFRHAVVNTIIVALISLALEIGVGLSVALALHAKFRGR